MILSSESQNVNAIWSSSFKRRPWDSWDYFFCRLIPEMIHLAESGSPSLLSSVSLQD